MPPKVKITKQNIIDTALTLIRAGGESALNARGIAAALNCSTQPIFSNFESMDLLRSAVVERAEKLCEKYVEDEMREQKYPPYKASGMAYIRVAKEEKELFKLLYMRDRSTDSTAGSDSLWSIGESLLKNSSGLDGEDARIGHLEMWIYVHGIATMIATDFLDLDWELISKMLSDAYNGLKKQHIGEK